MAKKSINVATFSRKAELLDASQPFAFKEAYKSMRTNLNFATLGGEVKSIVVTSSIPGEGKTTYSINLAITLADAGKKVLLVDADLRNPSVQRYLRLRQQGSAGLSNYLSSNTSLESVIGHFEKYNIDLILSGPIPPNPIELLDSGKIVNLIEKVKGEYDFIIFDTPPTTLVADSSVLSKYCDGIVVIVGQGTSTQEQVKKTKERLEHSGTKIIGAVLNNYMAKKDSKNRSSEYSQYYSYGEDV